MTIRVWLGLVLHVLLFARSYAQGASPGAASELKGTSWQLVTFLSGDGSKLTPDDTSKYTIALESSGSLSVRIDCNRGRGTWKSAGANQIEFGPLALTRAMCPQSPLNDHIPKHWEHVRSYIIKGGHLFLSLMADGGTYEFEPMVQAGITGLPATFIGNWPCADCPGILYQVNLMADHNFSSRMTYQERPSRLDDQGQWQLYNNGKTLTLQGEHETPATFALQDSNTLRKLDSNGNEIASNLNYDLKRNPTFLPFESHSAEIDGAPLENTYWKLSRLNGTEINPIRKTGTSLGPQPEDSSHYRRWRMQSAVWQLSDRRRPYHVQSDDQHNDGLCRRDGYRKSFP